MDYLYPFVSHVVDHLLHDHILFMYIRRRGGWVQLGFDPAKDAASFDLIDIRASFLLVFALLLLRGP